MGYVDNMILGIIGDFLGYKYKINFTLNFCYGETQERIWAHTGERNKLFILRMLLGNSIQYNWLLKRIYTSLKSKL